VVTGLAKGWNQTRAASLIDSLKVSYAKCKKVKGQEPVYLSFNSQAELDSARQLIIAHVTEKGIRLNAVEKRKEPAGTNDAKRAKRQKTDGPERTLVSLWACVL
jgi:hypothetical protein